MAQELGYSDDDQESPAKYFTVVVTVQPADAAVAIGADCTFSMDYAAIIPSEITLQWQCCLNFDRNGRSDDPGPIWADLAESGGIYTGTTTKTLTVHAVDNLLGAGPSGLTSTSPAAGKAPAYFRCKVLFAGTVPTFTDPAKIVAAGALTWQGVCYPDETAIGAQSGHTAFPVATAPSPFYPSLFPGPYTYAWNFVSGDAFVCASPTSAAAPFTFAGSDGFHTSIWTVTVSNGTISTTSDPLTLIALFGVQVGAFPCSPANTPLGLPFQAVPSFSQPWQIIATRRQRIGATPTAQILAPASIGSAFSLSGVQPGGTAITAFLGGQPDPAQIFSFGSCVWAGTGNPAQP